MNAAEDDSRSTFACLAADFVAAQRVEGVNADAHDVARRDRIEVDGIERFINHTRIAVLARRRRGKHVKPSWCDDRRAERDIAGIDEVDAHELRTKST
jgi:hypothetical protein